MLFKVFFFGALLSLSARAQYSEYTQDAESESTDDPPNTLAIWNTPYRTGAVNATWFIVPVNKTIVEKVVAPYTLLKLPEVVFPKGSFPNDSHPVIAQLGYQNDIRQLDLQISKLMAGSLLVPFVDRLNNGYTPFIYPLKNWIGGVENSLEAVVPAVVSTLFGTPVDIAEFNPVGSAYTEVDTDTYSSEVREDIVDNPISGPSIAPELVDMEFTTDEMPLFTNHTFHMILNQPQMLDILELDQCFRNTIYFNQSFSHPTFRNGNVTFYDGLLLNGFTGVYQNISGFSAVGEEIGYPAQNCSEAAQDVAPLAAA